LTFATPPIKLAFILVIADAVAVIFKSGDTAAANPLLTPGTKSDAVPVNVIFLVPEPPLTTNEPPCVIAGETFDMFLNVIAVISTSIVIVLLFAKTSSALVGTTPPTNTVSVAGGAGLNSSIDGSPVTRAVGGATEAGSPVGPGCSAAENTGTGGGGAYNAAGGAGGKGLVIIRYKFQ
jgi:hypothetical protein